MISINSAPSIKQHYTITLTTYGRHCLQWSSPRNRH